MMPRGALLLACERFGIEAPLERAHFFAQCAHESMGFTTLVENVNYSAIALRRVWPNRFNDAQAADYARQPERIANRAYRNRMGNGDEASGDGWRFRGRGFIQTTGRHNYEQASLALFGDRRLLTEPELLEQPLYAAQAAAFYWVSHDIARHALRDDVTEVTRKINGGLTGLDDRKHWLDKFKSEFGVEP